MQTTGTPKENFSTGISHIVPWRVTEVSPLSNFRLEVRFVDGTHGIVDMKRFLERDCGVFKSIREKTVFDQVRVEHGAVTWPGDLDLAPDTMHDMLIKAETYVME